MAKTYKSLANLSEFKNHYLYEYLQECEKEYLAEINFKKRYQKYQSTRLKHQEEKVSPKNTEETTSLNATTIDISGYYNNLMQIKTIEELEIILPINAANLNDIIFYLLLNIAQEINEYYVFYLSEEDGEFKDSILASIKEFKEKEQLLQEYYQRKLQGGIKYVRKQ